MQKIFIAIIVLLVVAFGIKIIFPFKKTTEPAICTMEVKMCPDGSYVGRSGLQCEFAECPKVAVDIHANLIKVSTPATNALVASPLVVSGEARGNWYFEASFPIRLYDASGVELVAVPAQAQGEWMTTEFVPFSATLNFNKPATATGTLVFEKDNPSGLPENDDQISIPVRFSP